jgi:Mu transposase, C-terminal domain
MVSVGGNLYSVPDGIRERVVEVQNHPREVRIFEDLIASHPLLEGRNQRCTDPAHRKPVPARSVEPAAQGVGRRPLAFSAVGRRLAGGAVS